MRYEYDAFISYSTRDKDHASKFFTELQNRQFKCWQDIHEIDVGELFPEKIEQGIKKSRYLLVWLSPHSIQSNWVQRELDLMYSRELDEQTPSIIPIKGGDYKIPDYLNYLQNRQHADFTGSFDSGLESVLKVLNANSSVMINYFVQNLLTGKDIDKSASRLGDLVRRTKDEEAFWAFWEVVKKNPKILVADSCSYNMWFSVIETGDAMLENIFFDVAEKSIRSEVEVLIDKFAYAMGQVALLSPNEETRSRAIKFIQRKIKSKSSIVQEKYDYTRNRVIQTIKDDFG